MTLTDLQENACCKNMQPVVEQDTSNAVGLALREAVWQAQEQGRLRCGVEECAQLLEIDPFNVMMCVMPVSGPDDVSAIIQKTLIQAFCHEYQIRLIKVDSGTKLGKVLEGRTPPSSPQPSHTSDVPPETSRVDSTPADVSCVLLQYPESGAASEEEEKVAQHYKANGNDNYIPTIALPD